MNQVLGVAPTVPRREPPGDAAIARARRAPRLDRTHRVRARSSSATEATTALRETVEAIWRRVAHVSSAGVLEESRDTTGALLARRELVRQGTCALSAVIRRGVAAGAFRPHCPAWAIEHLPFAIVAGACVHWMLGLAQGPALRASTAVAAALEVLRPGHEGARQL